MPQRSHQSPPVSAHDEWLPYVKRHKIITDALKCAAAGWQKAADSKAPELAQRCLPKSHPVYDAVRADFGSLVQAKEGLDYHRLLKIQVASSKGLGGKLMLMQKRMNIGKQPRIEAKSVILPTDSQPGSLHEAFSEIREYFLDEPGIRIWEAGFRAGIRYATTKNAAKSPPDRSMTRSDQFWLTYEAWLILETNPFEKRKVCKNTFPAQIISILCTIGVIEAQGELVFPTSKHGTFKRMKIRTLEDNLTDWVNDFRALAQIPK